MATSKKFICCGTSWTAIAGLNHLRITREIRSNVSTLGGSGRQAKHLCILLLHFVRLVIADDDGRVRVAPCNRGLIDLKTTYSQVGDIYSLVVFLIDSLENYLLLLMIDFDYVVILGVR